MAYYFVLNVSISFMRIILFSTLQLLNLIQSGPPHFFPIKSSNYLILAFLLLNVSITRADNVASN
jgi:hypothetical protein